MSQPTLMNLLSSLEMANAPSYDTDAGYMTYSFSSTIFIFTNLGNERQYVYLTSEGDVQNFDVTASAI